MINLISRSKDIFMPKESSYQISQKKIDSYQKDKFSNILDNSFSEQKELSQEIKEQKFSIQKKKINALQQKFNTLKEKLENEKDQESSLTNLSSLHQMFDVLQNTFIELENQSFVENENITQVFEINSVLIDFIDQSLNEIVDLGIMTPQMISMNQKFTFLFDQENSVHEIINANSQILETTLEQLRDVVQVSQEILVSNENKGSIELKLGEFEFVEDLEVLANDIANMTSEQIDVDDVSNNAAFEFSSDEDGSQDKFSDSLLIKDQRAKNFNQDKQNFSSFNIPQTLEKIDAIDLSSDLETIDATGDKIINTNPSRSNFLSSVQRTYNVFSSSVSRVQVEALMQNLSAKAAIILNDGANELRLKLTPPELGQMKLSFLSEDGIMTGKVVVETSEAKMFFEQNLDNLRESLANEGIQLSNVSIELGNHNDFGSQDDQDHQQSYQAIRTTSSNIESHNLKINKLEDSQVDFTA